jgi:hypothetical protein
MAASDVSFAILMTEKRVRHYYANDTLGSQETSASRHSLTESKRWELDPAAQKGYESFQPPWG